MKTDRYRHPTRESLVKPVFTRFVDVWQPFSVPLLLLALVSSSCASAFAQTPQSTDQMTAAEFAARISATTSKDRPINKTPLGIDRTGFPPELKPTRLPGTIAEPTALQPKTTQAPKKQSSTSTSTNTPGGPTSGLLTRPEQQYPAVSQRADPQPAARRIPQISVEQSGEQASALIRNVINRIANGAAFDAKVRQRVWTAGREIVGVGTYLQAGQGTGRFNLQLTMHDGDGKHTLQQISDGRLAWTRTIISEHVSLRRVDVGRLSEWVREANQGKPSEEIPVRLRIGAWTEILDSIQRDYVLQLGTSKRKKLLVISGTLRAAARERIQSEAGVKEWPELFPTHVKIAIAPVADPETGFGEGLPVRMEFWSDPIANPQASDVVRREGRLVSLIELYSIRPITAPPVERFRFENQDARVNFTNETERYLRRYNIRLTESQRKQARR